MICYATEFHWTEIIRVVACQYGQTLTDEQLDTMDWSEKVNYLKRNPVTVVRQIDHKVILSEMHPIGQILNFDD